MSAPIILNSIELRVSTTGALPTVATLRLSNGTMDEVTYGAYDSPEQVIKQIANRLVELNQVAYWHPITTGLIDALVKFKRAVVDKNENSIHLLKDMQGANKLTPHQWNNFTKLRFHGLAVKDTKAGSGYWLLTKRGNQFVKGELAIPRKVKTENNEVKDHDDVFVTVDQVYGETPYFTTQDTLEAERHFTEPQQTGFAI